VRKGIPVTRSKGVSVGRSKEREEESEPRSLAWFANDAKNAWRTGRGASFCDAKTATLQCSSGFPGTRNFESFKFHELERGGGKVSIGEREGRGGKSDGPLTDERGRLSRRSMVLNARRVENAAIQLEHLRVDLNPPSLRPRSRSEFSFPTDGFDGGATLGGRFRGGVEHLGGLGSGELGRGDGVAVEEL
jgi:hypothetical protein